MVILVAMTLDTNILIPYLDNESSISLFLDEARKKGTPLFLPAAVEAEFLSFPTWTNEQRQEMEKFLEENFLFVPLDRSIARLAASIRIKTKIKFADASIAATAIFTNTPLATRNTRDFKNVSGLELFSF